MSRRPDDDLSALLDELSGTLDRLRTELGEEGRRRPARRGERESGERDTVSRRTRRGPSVPSPGRFLRFTEEYTIPALIAFLEANVRALELLQGLLRLLDGGEVSDRRVESVGRRTLGQVDDLLSDVQGTLEGQPSNPDARNLLDEARSLRTEIDDRIAGGAIRRGGDRRTGRGRRDADRRGDVATDDGDRRPRARDAPAAIDVSEDDERERRRGDDRGRKRTRGEGRRARRDEVDVDSELDSLRRQVRGDGEDDAGDETGDDAPSVDGDDENGE